MADKIVKCKVCGEEIAKSARACPKCGAKQKKHPILAAILVIFGIIILLSAIGGKSDDDPKRVDSAPPRTSQNDPKPAAKEDAEKDPPEESFGNLEEEIPILLTEEEKEKILEIDSSIWSLVMSAEENYNSLLSSMENTNSIYDLYRFCENLEDGMTVYSTNISNVSDSRAEDYKQYAGLYCFEIGQIASCVKKYADTGDMKHLSKAEEYMQILPAVVSDVVSSRFGYLAACGFSDEEIVSIGEMDSK